MAYLTANEIAFASKVHIASFAQKDTSKMIGGTDVKQIEISGTKQNPNIQDVQPAAYKALKDTLHGALALTTKRAKPTWDTVAKKWINGWTNGVGA